MIYGASFKDRLTWLLTTNNGIEKFKRTFWIYSVLALLVVLALDPILTYIGLSSGFSEANQTVVKMISVLGLGLALAVHFSIKFFVLMVLDFLFPKVPFFLQAIFVFMIWFSLADHFFAVVQWVGWLF